MPILECRQGEDVIVIKRGQGAGFSRDRERAVLSRQHAHAVRDAQKAVAELIQAIKRRVRREIAVNRRTLLKGAAALPVVALAVCGPVCRAGARTLAAATRASRDAAWPLCQCRAQGRRGGNLIEVQFAVRRLLRKSPAAAACLEATEKIHNPFYIGDQPAGTQVSGWLDAWRRRRASMP